jgi:hypothetical protein
MEKEKEISEIFVAHFLRLFSAGGHIDTPPVIEKVSP